jgi:hypothetical protein
MFMNSTVVFDNHYLENNTVYEENVNTTIISFSGYNFCLKRFSFYAVHAVY